MQPQTSATMKKRRSAKPLVIVIAILLVLGAWTQGTFDHLLVNVGLQYNDCARNGFGATFCGDELEEYQIRIGEKAPEMSRQEHYYGSDTDTAKEKWDRYYGRE